MEKYIINFVLLYNNALEYHTLVTMYLYNVKIYCTLLFYQRIQGNVCCRCDRVIPIQVNKMKN